MNHITQISFPGDPPQATGLEWWKPLYLFGGALPWAKWKGTVLQF